MFFNATASSFGSINWSSPSFKACSGSEF